MNDGTTFKCTFCKHRVTTLERYTRLITSPFVQNGLTDTHAFGNFIEAALRWTPIAQDLNRNFVARQQPPSRRHLLCPPRPFSAMRLWLPQRTHDPSA